MPRSDGHFLKSVGTIRGSRWSFELLPRPRIQAHVQTAGNQSRVQRTEGENNAARARWRPTRLLSCVGAGPKERPLYSCGGGNDLEPARDHRAKVTPPHDALEHLRTWGQGPQGCPHVKARLWLMWTVLMDTLSVPCKAVVTSREQGNSYCQF